MARSFLTSVNLNKNELQNAAVQNLATAPSSPVKGQIYFDTVGNILYWYNGTGWVAAQGGAGAVPATTVTTEAVGDAPVVGTATTYAREDHKHGRESFGAITAQTAFGAASSNGAATTLARSDHVHGTPTHDAAAHSAIPFSALAAATANVSMGGFLLTNVGTAVSGTDATNKNYVDNLVTGLAWKDSVRVASTTNVTASGTPTVDGVTTVAGNRVLLMGQTLPELCGIYVVAAGAWARATDADTGAELASAAVFVEEGTLNADTAWVCTNNQNMTLNSDAVTFVKFVGGGTVTAGAGLTQSGNTINVIADASITVTADQISRAALTGDVTSPAGSNATTIATSAVTNAKMADMASLTIKGNQSGTGPPQDLSGAAVGGIIGGYFVKRMSQTVGDASALAYVVTHSFGFQQVAVSVYRTTTPWDEVECDIEHTSTNTVTVRFAVAPTLNQYTVAVLG